MNKKLYLMLLGMTIILFSIFLTLVSSGSFWGGIVLLLGIAGFLVAVCAFLFF